MCTSKAGSFEFEVGAGFKLGASGLEDTLSPHCYQACFTPRQKRGPTGTQCLPLLTVIAEGADGWPGVFAWSTSAGPHTISYAVPLVVQKAFQALPPSQAMFDYDDLDMAEDVKQAVEMERSCTRPLGESC